MKRRLIGQCAIRNNCVAWFGLALKSFCKALLRQNLFYYNGNLQFTILNLRSCISEQMNVMTLDNFERTVKLYCR